ncbi:MAG: nitroreductase family protein [Pseudomonadota bacterium]
MTPDLFRSLVARASLAPSVHNVQPALWRLDGEDILLIEDATRRLNAADPTGHDAAISLGAAYEGLRLAAAEEGLISHIDRSPGTLGDQQVVARITLTDGGTPDPLSAVVEARQSWRGAFALPTSEDRQSVRQLAAEDSAVLVTPDQIATVAALNDRASYRFMVQNTFRAELLSWMRLRPGHPRWSIDGLNAQALRLGLAERLGAGIVMGAAFPVLRRLGLAAPLLAEAPKTRGAAGILVLHRPAEEDPFESGRAFYRAWLRMEAAGLGAAVMAALADDAEAARDIRALAGIPEDRRIVSAFRIGRRPPHDQVPRARRPLEELIV